MTTQRQQNADGDSYERAPVVRLGQGDYTRDYYLDDERPGISDGLFALLVGMGYMFILMLVVLAVLTWFGTLTWNWST